MNLDFRDCVFNSVKAIMEKDPNVVLLTNDMGAAGVDQIKAIFPERMINVGIAEQNLMSVAAGISMRGYSAFCYGIASHISSRAYEQIRLDICVQKLPVTLLAIGAGLAYGADGPTHHSLHDVPLIGTLPGMSIYNPSCGVLASKSVELAYQSKAPSYVRIDKDQLPALYDAKDAKTFAEGAAFLRQGKDAAILTSGVMVRRALEVAESLQADGISVAVVDFFRLKPLQLSMIQKVVSEFETLLTLEEQISFGSLGMQVAQVISQSSSRPKLIQLNLGEGLFLGAATRPHIHSQNGMTKDQVVSTLKKELAGRRN